MLNGDIKNFGDIDNDLVINNIKNEILVNEGSI